MNHRQRCVLIVGSLGIFVMLLVPPWEYSIAEHRDIRYDWLVYDVSLGYGFVLRPPRLYRDAGELHSHFAKFVRIDGGRLLVQGMAAAAAVGLLLAVFTEPTRADFSTSRRAE